MDLDNVRRLETLEQYEFVCFRVDELLREASAKGMLASEYDNEYTREIGRLSNLGAIYENEYMRFEHLNVKTQSPPQTNRIRRKKTALEYA